MAVLDRAHRGAVAEVGDDHVLARDLGRHLPQRPYDVFVGQPVKPVAPHALVVIGARQGEGVVHEGMAAMERRVETGDLRRSGKSADRRLDPGDVVRLVKGRERDELAQLGEYGLVDQHRRGKVGPSVNDAVADRDDALRVAHVLEPAENDPGRRLVVELGRRSVEDELGLFAGRPLDRAFRGRADSLDLACGNVRDFAVVGAEGGELQRRRAGVKGQDDSAQGRALRARVIRRPWRPTARPRTPGPRGDNTGKAGPAHRTQDARGHCRRGSSA